jgi:hypothetical protein
MSKAQPIWPLLMKIKQSRKLHPLIHQHRPFLIHPCPWKRLPFRLGLAI